jgi:hypothetical protein
MIGKILKVNTNSVITSVTQKSLPSLHSHYDFIIGFRQILFYIANCQDLRWGILGACTIILFKVIYKSVRK